MGGHAHENRVKCLGLKREQWVSKPDLPQAVTDPMVVMHNNQIFVFGGREEQKKALFCTPGFDTTLGQWSTLLDRPDVCENGAAIALNDFVYVVGGDNRICLKDSAYSYISHW